MEYYEPTQGNPYRNPVIYDQFALESVMKARAEQRAIEEARARLAYENAIIRQIGGAGPRSERDYIDYPFPSQSNTERSEAPARQEESKQENRKFAKRMMSSPIGATASEVYARASEGDSKIAKKVQDAMNTLRQFGSQIPIEMRRAYSDVPESRVGQFNDIVRRIFEGYSNPQDKRLYDDLKNAREWNERNSR